MNDQSEDEDLEHSSDNFDDPGSSSDDQSDDEEEGSVSNTVDPFADIPRNAITEMIISNIQLRAIEKAYLDLDLYKKLHLHGR